MLIAGGSALLLALAARVQMEIPSPVIAVVGPLGVVPMPEGNPVTRAKVDLGQRPFEDPALSGDSSTSCLTCHLPEHGFAAPEPLGPVCPSQTERRNAPTRVSVAYNLPLAYGDEQITPAHVGNAISSFERTLAFEDAPIDRYTLITGLRRSG